MIDRTEAERIAAAINTLRPDWPIPQLITLIAELRTWPLLDLATGLTHVAVERDLDGAHVSRSPYRVKEPGPWRTARAAATQDAERAERERRDRERRDREREAIWAAIAACEMCDATGQLPTGHPCHHDPTAAERARVAMEAIQRELARSGALQ